MVDYDIHKDLGMVTIITGINDNYWFWFGKKMSESKTGNDWIECISCSSHDLRSTS